MPNFVEQFKAAVRVSTPLVAVRTFDASSAIAAMMSAYGSKVEEQGLILYDCVNGTRPLNKRGKEAIENMCQGQEGGLAATVVLENTLWFAEKAWAANKGDQRDNVLFISNAHLFMNKDKPAVLQGIWNLRNVLKVNGHMCVLLLAPGATLPAELANDVLVIEEPLPTREELADLVKKHHDMIKADPPKGLVLDSAVDALVGLPQFGADQSLAMSLSGKTKQLDMDELWARKRELIAATRGLKLHNGKETLESIGGSAQVIEFYRAWFEGPEAPSIILFLDEVEKQFSGTGNADGHKSELAGYFQTWTEDNGIQGGALVGIPGCGKTAIAKGLAGTFKRPLITVDISEMQDKHVGESGAYLRAACARILAIAGPNGKIAMIGTSNGMDNLPLGLRRRFEYAPMFFFEVPNAEEKASIWTIQLKAHGLDTTQALPAAKGWTGAEIRNCCAKAKVLGCGVLQAAKWVIPVTQSEAPRIEAIRHHASGKLHSAAVEGTYRFDEATKEVFDGGEIIAQGTRKVKG
jgi:hypothetical protein